MPTLRQLEGRLMWNWIERHPPGEWVNGVNSIDGVHRYRKEVPTLSEAHEVDFLCPKCFAANGGAIGTHGCIVSFAGRDIPAGCGSIGSNGQPTRWQIVGGVGLDDLQLAPSIQLLGGCNWHGFIGNSGIPAGSAG